MAERPRALLQSRPAGGRYEIEGEATIGRALRHPVVIEDGRVSSDHARIAWDETAGCFVLEDLGSTNGTELDGVRLRAPEPLGRLHTITFAGVHHFVFRDLSAPALDTAPVTPLGAHGTGEKTAIGELPAVPPPSLGGAGSELPGESTDAHGAPLAVPPSLLEEEREGTLTGDERALPLPPELAARAEALRADTVPEPTVPEPTVPEPTVPPAPAPPADVVTDSGADDSPSSPFAQIDPAVRAIGEGDDANGEEAAPFERLDAPPRHALEVVFEDGRIERYPLRAGSNLIGRGRDADVRIESPHLSRRHASVRVMAGTIAVRDLGSSNYTFVAGHRIETEVEIEVGDTLRLGNLAARVVAEREQEGSDR